VELQDPVKSEGQIVHEGERIPFTVVRTDRRTLAIVVHPDSTVVVRAPRRARDAAVTRAVAGRADWITRKRAEMAARPRQAPLPAPDKDDLARARRTFEERLDACWAVFASPEEVRPRIRVRAMRSRWGSLSPAGAMSLNAHLMHVPQHCIDYVIFHELCHLRVRSHGPDFYEHLARYVPRYKALRRELAGIRL